jgi:hypothetical protein
LRHERAYVGRERRNGCDFHPLACCAICWGRHQRTISAS